MSGGDVEGEIIKARENKEKGDHIPPARKGSMGPPPLPSSAPRMTRLPSLQQISDRLNHPSPLSTQSPSSGNIESPITMENPSTPPKLKVAINTNTATANINPYTASPSGRLKLPPSAMMRSHSASSVSSHLPTLNPIPKPDASAVFTNPDPFASPGLKDKGQSESMSRGPSKEGYIKGYKDVPSLSAIRARMGSIKSLVTELPTTEESPVLHQHEVENIVPELVIPPSIDPSPSTCSTTSSTNSDDGRHKGEHALKHAWTLYFDSKNFKPDPSFVKVNEGETLGDYEKSLVNVGRFETVEGFARHLNNVRLPSNLARNSNYHMFKNGIRPMWEDPANANGGKWVILFRSAPHLLDIAWANLTMSLVGEILDPEDKVCGVVASARPKVDRIQVWTRVKDDVDAVNLIGRRILESMALEGRESENMSMEFQYNAGNANPATGLFLHIPFTNRSASFAHAPPTPSRLSVPSPGLGERHGLVHHPSLPLLPRSPTTPRSPLSARSPGEMRDNLAPPGFSTPRRGSASSAFSGPMGGFGGTSPRRQSVQLGEAK